MSSATSEERVLVWGNPDLQLNWAAQQERLTVREYVIWQARRMMDYYGLEDWTFYLNSNPRLKRWGKWNWKEKYIALSETGLCVSVEVLVIRLSDLISGAVEFNNRGRPSCDHKWKCRYASMITDQLGDQAGEVIVRRDYRCRWWADKILRDVEKDRKMLSREQLLAMFGKPAIIEDIEE